jgi:cytochrome c peroxidase
MRRLLTAVALILVPCTAPAAEGENTVTLGDPALTAGIPGTGELTLDQIEAWLARPENHAVLDLRLPLGLAAGQAQMVGLDANPPTRAKIELGRQLYFDGRLSADGTISCATCHAPDEGFASRRRVGVGINSLEGERNSPTAYNRILSGTQFWDGRAASLEEQAKGPIANPIEMGNTHEATVATVKALPGYAAQFAAVFPREGVTIDTIAQAIACFERVIVTGPSPFDYAEDFRRFAELTEEDLADIKENEPEVYSQYSQAVENTRKFPMSESATRGRELFFSERVGCTACHVGPNLTDEKYHNLGVGADLAKVDVGRFALTQNPADWGAFKTPTIRNVELTAPYMHDGSQKTLEEVVEHYNKGGTPNKALSDKVKKLDLTPQESADLVAFMRACTGPFPKVEPGRLPADH